MAKQKASLKQLAIDKDNSAIIIAVGLASFIVVFCLIASHALIKQSAYQNKVIGKKKAALNQAKKNVEEVKKLHTSYQAFASQEQNVLGGSSRGSGDKDGENPRLILDALPSKYDFPALTTSLEKTFKQYSLESITGTDDEKNQAAVPSSGTPQPVEMPFAVGVNGSAANSKEILQQFEKSIRPFQIQKINITGSSSQLQINITAKTYFQPQKKFEVKTEKVK